MFSLGDVLLITHLSYKTYTTVFNLTSDSNTTSIHSYHYQLNNTLDTTSRDTILPHYLQLPESYNLPDLLFYILISILSSELTYHSICGFLQVYFYVLKRGEPERWKCQPHRFLTRSNEVHEIVVGTVNMFFAGGKFYNNYSGISDKGSTNHKLDTQLHAPILEKMTLSQGLSAPQIKG